MNRVELFRDLARVMNEHSVDNALNTPDYILADLLVRTLETYKATKEANDRWHVKKP